MSFGLSNVGRKCVIVCSRFAEFGVDPFEPHEFTDEDDHAATEWQQVAGRKLTKMCRAGIPAHFRGGVWNKIMSPTMDEAGTPSHKAGVQRFLGGRRVQGGRGTVFKF